ncbi:uncharacterized protein LTR77_004961 [Saxophila tyrrhenica]|uniref:BTB domain-containing protein n=1 Tax=Saxophila tyrrhenica TaxID=1690608 RepID=A0AAV9PD27_9PEZI|nr:hypothetical protein LTR77_004961 [Saxophila tyrrhenica]
MAGNWQGPPYAPPWAYHGPPPVFTAPPPNPAPLPLLQAQPTTTWSFVPVISRTDRTRSIRGFEEGGPNLSTEMVTIDVSNGENRERFVVHKELIMKHSRYFRGMFGNNFWEEAKDEYTTMDSVDPEAFKLLQRFIYTGVVYSRADEQFRPSNQTSEDPEWAKLWSAWELGDKINSATFMDAVTDAVRAKITDDDDCMCPISGIQGIFNIGPSSSGIRKLLVDAAVWRWDRRTLTALRPDCELPHKFLHDFAVASMGSRSRFAAQHGAEGHAQEAAVDPLDESSPCVYHNHDLVCYQDEI